MHYTSLDQLAQRVSSGTGPKRVMAVICPEEEHCLEAIIHAASEDLVTPLLFGDKPVIEGLLEKMGTARNAFAITHVPGKEEAARTAGLALKAGEAHFLMKGLIPTAVMLKALFAEDVGFRVGQFVSHMSIVEIPHHPKLVTLTDCAINIAPTLEQKTVILENTLHVLHRLGMTNPKVAVLAAAEVPNPKMPETLDAAELAAMNKRGEITGCVVEGPLSYDLAMCPESAEIKSGEGTIRGDADVLLCPGIAAGNILLKALRHSAGARTAGIVVGGAAPIVLTSRAATTQDKYWPMVLAASATL